MSLYALSDYLSKIYVNVKVVQPQVHHFILFAG